METMNPTFWISPNFALMKDTQGNETFSVSNVLFNKITDVIKTPFYVYDLHTIKKQYEILSQALASIGISIYYSVKANTSLAIVDLLQTCGSGLEIASEGELHVAKKLKVHPRKISFAGPVKSENTLEEAIRYGVGIINAESVEEFFRINSIAEKLGVVQTVGIRVNPKKEITEAGGFMGGGPRKFGIDEEMITEDLINKIRTLKHVKLAGLHVFSATQILSETALLENFQNICEIAYKLNELFEIKSLDFGGGLGIPYIQNENPLPISRLTEKIQKLIKKYPFIKKNNTKLLIEPGRYLVGASGIYVTQVDNVKTSRGIKMVLVDGGIHHLLRPALFPQTNAHPIYNISQIHKPSRERYDIGGALCTSLDFLGKNVPLPETRPGDFLGIFNVGAYGWSEAMPYFLSHTMPAEVAIYEGNITIIRDHLSAKNFVSNQHKLKKRSKKKI